MNAPDKIYVFQHGINAFDPLWHFTKSKEKNTEFHEYIRKDALLEWARMEQKKYREDTQFDMGYLRAVNDLIKKLESL